MADLADLGMRFSTEGGEQAVKVLDQVEDGSKRTEKATDSLAGAQKRSGSAWAQMIANIERAVTEMRDLQLGLAEGAMAALREADAMQKVATSANVAAPAINKAGASAKATAQHFDTLYDQMDRDFVGQYVAGMNRLPVAHGKAVVSSKALQGATLGLTRQFADVGVSAAMGINPLMILIQQGPQIADTFAVAKMQGLGFRAALQGITASLVPILIALAPLATLAGAAAGGFLLLNRQLQKGFPKDVTAGLGLTEEQLDRVKHKTVTMGDVFKSTLQVMGKYLTMGPVGDGIKWLVKTWNDGLDAISKAAFEATADVVALFLGAYRTIASNWRNFPAALADVFVLAFNAALDEVQRFTNAQIQSLNAIKNAAALFMPSFRAIPNIPEADLSRFKGKVSGAAEFVTRSFASNFMQAREDAKAGMQRMGAEIAAGALKIAQDRARKEAGKPGKGSADRDEVAERLQSLAAEAAGNRVLAEATDLTTAAGVRALAQQKALNDAARVSKAGIDQQTVALKFYAAELAVIVTAAAKQAEEQVAKTNAQSQATEQATALIDKLGVSQATANQMVADGNRLATLRAAYDAADLKDKPLLAKAINDTAEAQERKNLADQASFLAQAHASAKDQLDQLRLEASLIGASNAERDVAIAQLKEEQLLRQKNVHPALMDGSANPAYKSAVDDAKEVAGATADAQAAQEAYNVSLDHTLNMLDLIADRTQTMGDGLASAFGKAGQAAAAFGNAMASFAAQQESIRVREADEIKRLTVSQNASDEEKARSALAIAHVQEEASAQVANAKLQHDAAILDSAKNLFGKQTAAYKALQLVQQVYYAEQFALQAKAIALDVINTIKWVANSGLRAAANGVEAVAKAMASMPFPLNLAAAAATAAALVAFGVKIFGGGGGGGSVPSAEDLQKAAGTGSVLGDPTAKSESIARSLEIVAANSNKDLEYFNPMLKALKSIDTNIGLVAASLAQQLGSGGAFDTSKLNLGASSKLSSQSLFGPIVGNIPIIGDLLNGVANLISKIPVIGGVLKSLFGTTKTSTLQDQGVQFGQQSLADLLSQGVDASTYQTVNTHSKSKFLGLTYSNSNKTSTTTQAISDDIAGQLTTLVGSLRDGVLAAANALGVKGAEATLDAFQVNLGKLSFKDLTGQEIQDQLNAVFGKLGDDLASAVLPALAQFQKVGEGALETLSRVAREYQVVDVALQSIGKTFNGVGASSIAARDRLVNLFDSMDDFVSQTQFFADNFLSDSERIAPVIDAVDKQLTALGLSGINTKEAFKNLVEGLDVSTQAGAEMYANLLALAPAFAKVIDFMTNGSQDVSDARDDLTKAYQAEAQAIQDTQSKFQSFADTLKSFRASLDTGPNALLTPEAQYNATKAAFLDVSARAKLGDADALGQLQGVSQDYLDASKAYYASSGKYFQDLSAVKVAVSAAQATSQRTADNATQQLDALKASVSGLITINESVLSVRDAIIALQAAQSAYGQSLPVFTGGTGTPPILPTVDGDTPTGPDTPGPKVTATGGGVTVPVTLTPPDLTTIQQALAAGGFGTTAIGGGGNLSAFGPVQYFATGGEFTVGGSGGTDSQHFGSFMATPGEIVNVRRPGDTANDNAELIAEMKALRAEVVALRGQVAKGDQANVDATHKAAERQEKALDRQGRTDRLVRGGRAA